MIVCGDQPRRNFYRHVFHTHTHTHTKISHTHIAHAILKIHVLSTCGKAVTPQSSSWALESRFADSVTECTESDCNAMFASYATRFVSLPEMLMRSNGLLRMFITAASSCTQRTFGAKSRICLRVCAREHYVMPPELFVPLAGCAVAASHPVVQHHTPLTHISMPSD